MHMLELLSLEKTVKEANALVSLSEDHAHKLQLRLTAELDRKRSVQDDLVNESLRKKTEECADLQLELKKLKLESQYAKDDLALNLGSSMSDISVLKETITGLRNRLEKAISRINSYKVQICDVQLSQYCR